MYERKTLVWLLDKRVSVHWASVTQAIFITLVYIMSSEHVVWCTKNTERKVQGCGIMTSVLDASKFLALEVAERLSASLCSKINISQDEDWLAASSD